MKYDALIVKNIWEHIMQFDVILSTLYLETERIGYFSKCHSVPITDVIRGWMDKKDQDDVGSVGCPPNLTRFPHL